MKYMNMKRKITGIMVITAIILTLLSSCGGAEDNTSATTGDTTPFLSETESAQAQSELIENKTRGDLSDADFGGRDFNVLIRSHNHSYAQFVAEEQNGEPFNDAMYLRNRIIEDKYNIKIKQTVKDDPAADAQKSIMANDGAYDFIVEQIRRINSLATSRLLFDLYTVPYIRDNLENEWWDQALSRDLAINGELYFQTGDIVVFDKLRLGVMYFNKGMCRSLGIDEPYKYVRDGTWTLGKLVEMTKEINKDLDGDGEMGQYDRWGLMSQWEGALHLFISSGEKMIGLNKDGVPELTFDTPRALQVIDKIFSVALDGETMFMIDTIKNPKTENIWTEASAFFMEDRFLLRTSVLEPAVRDMRGMDTDFGLLPIAKYDEAQKDYYTFVESSGYAVGIPVTADAEYSGLITEELAYKSASLLMPAFYDLCLTSKILRDDDSEEMLDIIFKNKIYDIGYLFNINKLPTLLRDMAQNKTPNFASKFDAIKPSVELDLEKFYGQYQN